jgi:valyl-tRNA synthetase
MTENRQTTQGYIISILQHFTTKVWNITNFVMLFQAEIFVQASQGERSITAYPGLDRWSKMPLEFLQPQSRKSARPQF